MSCDDSSSKGDEPQGRPPFLLLGGEDFWPKYEAEFERLYRSGTVLDVIQRRVIFDVSAARHVCFQPNRKDRFYKHPRDVWVPERAERIPWIGHVLTMPDEIRPDPNGPPGRQSYLLRYPPLGADAEEFYHLVVKVGSKDVQFVTAFPVDRTYWKKMRRGGKAIYVRGKNK